VAIEDVKSWVTHVAAHTTPAKVKWCDGTAAEFADLARQMVETGTVISLNPERYPNSFLHRSHPNDVARVEDRTFICSEEKEDAGPTNNWMSPRDAIHQIWPLFKGAMASRTMYVIPYLMGPIGSPYSRVGVEITDSPYVVANMSLMTRMGKPALAHLRETGQDFVRGLHSVGDLDPNRRYILHIPHKRTIWSIGSGYGGNALLSKKCHALRIASVQARDEGWMAEHMLVLGVTTPSGSKHYVAAAFPSACGKTNLALMTPSLPGYQIETIGDDICWMHVGPDGRLWAINPEAGMFGVAPGTSVKTNANAMAALRHDAIFTNVALRDDGTPWWEGMDEQIPHQLTDWRGQRWNGGPEKAAHPNARFTVAMKQCPAAGSGLDDPRGVPISAIVFGGRRATLTPLVYEATSWQHGVYVGATMVSETTAAATGAVGVPRNDPMAMLPFCGYNMADYFRHWLTMGKRLTQPPRIFHVNWFRTDEKGQFLWPGFGENIRVLQWIVDRIEGEGASLPSPIGNLPTLAGINTSGLSFDEQRLQQLCGVDARAWREEAAYNAGFLARFNARMPTELRREHAALLERLEAA
jgi:phosphoenolpyruvate carboxykinase (GTP)